MRIRSIAAKNVLPITEFCVDELADVVVIAGRNGVGKTRLIQTLVQAFREPRNYGNITLTVEATSNDERNEWAQSTLITSSGQDAQKLISTLQKNRRRTSWKSSVVQIESDRSMIQIYPYGFTWDSSDPWNEMISWDQGFSGLRSRFQDTLHSIFRKVRSHREALASQAEQLWTQGAATMNLDWQDPLAPFKRAFSQLLAPKELVNVDLQQQALLYREGSQTFPTSELSSGEREVLHIVFDFILRNPEDCVVFFDEPELHLHPELSYKLLQTLRNVGPRNQFIFSTHSPDIITASLDQSVIFIGPSTTPPKNQAIPVQEHDETNEALRLLGQSVGIIALGKRLVLIEGTAGSLDKQVYGSILKDRYPDLVLVPSGGKGLITSFHTVISSVLEKAIWGVDFFMLCDRDALPGTVEPSRLEAESKGRLRVLPRYHLENYFLDATILARVFAVMEPEGSWLTDPHQIDRKLKEIATNMASYATALTVTAHIRQLTGNVDIMPKSLQNKTTDELCNLLATAAKSERLRIEGALNATEVTKLTRQVAADVATKLASPDGGWKLIIPGRPVLNSFASAAKLNVARLKHLYIREAEQANDSPFAEIIELFSTFSQSHQQSTS